MKELREELANAKCCLSESEDKIRSLKRCEYKLTELAEKDRLSQNQYKVNQAKLRATAEQLAKQEYENQRKIELLKSCANDLKLDRKKDEKLAMQFCNKVPAVNPKNVEFIKWAKASYGPNLVQVKVIFKYISARP